MEIPIIKTKENCYNSKSVQSMTAEYFPSLQIVPALVFENCCPHYPMAIEGPKHHLSISLRIYPYDLILPGSGKSAMQIVR